MLYCWEFTNVWTACTSENSTSWGVRGWGAQTSEPGIGTEPLAHCPHSFTLGGLGEEGTRRGWGAAQLWVLEKDCIACETLSSFHFHFTLGDRDTCPALGTRPNPLPHEVSAFPSQWGHF